MKGSVFFTDVSVAPLSVCNGTQTKFLRLAKGKGRDKVEECTWRSFSSSKFEFISCACIIFQSK